MIDIKQFESLQKSSSKSFHQQRNFIKKVLLGKETLCPVCHQTLQLDLPEDSDNPRIYCKKSCTDIRIDVG